MPPIRHKLRLAVITTLMAAVMIPAHAAQASTSQLSIMMDDDLLVYRDDTTRDTAMRRMKTLGVDAVRVTVLWSVLADGIEGKAKNKKQKAKLEANKKRFKKYGAADPRAYPPLNWNRFDGLVRACKTLQIICYLDLTGPGPSWGHNKPPKSHAKDARWWKPKPKEFYKFVQAVGKRYNGKYRDNDEGRTILPPVHMWAIWNEPNQGGWLRPQYLDGKPVSPSIYRELYDFGFRALASTGHTLRSPANPNGDVILMGETAPINVARKTTTSAMGPKIFINELFCGQGSVGTGCDYFKKKPQLQAYAWAHHPYTKKLAPNQPDPDPNAVTLANFKDLGTQLDGLAASTGHVQANMPLISTEFGYETNPPDPFAQTTLEQQALYLAIGEYMTSSDPRIIGNTQFLLQDVKPNKKYSSGSRNYWSTYQSGLFGSTGTAKPAATVYPFPFFAIPIGHDPNVPTQPVINIWGQIRFRANVLSDTAPDQVVLQWKAADGSTPDFVDLQPIAVTNQFGYFAANNITLPGPGLVRLHWASASQTPFDLKTLAQAVS